MRIPRDIYKEIEERLKSQGIEVNYDIVSKLAMRDEIDRIIDDLIIKEYTIEEILIFAKIFCLYVKKRPIKSDSTT